MLVSGNAFEKTQGFGFWGKGGWYPSNFSTEEEKTQTPPGQPPADARSESGPAQPGGAASGASCPAAKRGRLRRGARAVAKEAIK